MKTRLTDHNHLLLQPKWLRFLDRALQERRLGQEARVNRKGSDYFVEIDLAANQRTTAWVVRAFKHEVRSIAD